MLRTKYVTITLKVRRITCIRKAVQPGLGVVITKGDNQCSIVNVVGSTRGILSFCY